MPRDGAITFRDSVGKLAVLRITCDKCGRSGQYRLDRLIMCYGIDAKLFHQKAKGRPEGQPSRVVHVVPPRRSTKPAAPIGSRNSWPNLVEPPHAQM